MWGCITALGVGYATRIDGNLDAQLYKEILEDELEQTMEFYDMEPATVVFQQDNDPKHTSRIVREYLSTREFQVLDWPSQSPDLKPHRTYVGRPEKKAEKDGQAPEEPGRAVGAD